MILIGVLNDVRITVSLLNRYLLSLYVCQLTEKNSVECPRFVAFCVATDHSPFSVVRTVLYKQPNKTLEIKLLFVDSFRRLFPDCLPDRTCQSQSWIDRGLLLGISERYDHPK